MSRYDLLLRWICIHDGPPLPGRNPHAVQHFAVHSAHKTALPESHLSLWSSEAWCSSVDMYSILFMPSLVLVCLCSYSKSLWTWYLTNHLQEFYKIYNLGAMNTQQTWQQEFLSSRSATVERSSTHTAAAGTFLRFFQTIFENASLWRLKRLLVTLSIYRRYINKCVYLSIYLVGRKMNWLDFEAKRSKIKLTASHIWLNKHLGWKFCTYLQSAWTIIGETPHG